jgi:hypothetical protein
MSQTTGNGPLVARNYAHERDTLLRETHWTFARSEAALTLLANNTWSNYAFAYVYPADCLKIQYLCNPNLIANFPGYPYEPPLMEYCQRNCPHEVTLAVDSFGNTTGQKVILTNLEDATLIYTKLVSDTSLFPASFIDALVLRLARAICHRLLPNTPILRDLAMELQAADATAKRDAANENAEWMHRRSDFEDGRR